MSVLSKNQPNSIDTRKAFDILKLKLREIGMYRPNYSNLTIDTSNVSLGAVIYQSEDKSNIFKSMTIKYSSNQHGIESK